MARNTRFAFKKLDAYQAAVDFFGWSVDVTARIPWRYRSVGDQFIRAATSILGNIGESGGRRLKPAESSQHYRYAQGSTHECAAYLDALILIGIIDDDAYDLREAQLARIGSMLTRLIQRQERRRT